MASSWHELGIEVSNILRLASPVAVVNLCACLLQLTDLAVVGRVLGADALASVCLCAVVGNLALEPACFITANAVTTLCADALHKELTTARGYVKAALHFSFLVAIPIIALYLATPHALDVIGVSGGLVAGARLYAPAYATGVAPSLLLSAMQGLMRARGQLHVAGTYYGLGVLLNLPCMLAAVRAYGLPGAGLCTCAVRSVLLLILSSSQRQFLRNPSEVSRVSRKRPPLRDFFQLYSASLLPATLRFGATPLLVIVAVLLGCSSEQAAAFCLATFLLQTCLAVCVGIQQASLMLTARYLNRGQPSATRLVMIIATTSLIGFSAGVWLVLGVGSEPISALFCPSRLLLQAFETVSGWVAPMLFFKSTSGLFGQFLAVSGHGTTGTALLLIFPWCLGLPGAYALGWHAQQDEGEAAVPRALLQAQTGAWMATAVCFFLAYALCPARSFLPMRSQREPSVRSSEGSVRTPARAPPPASLPKADAEVASDPQNRLDEPLLDEEKRDTIKLDLRTT